MSQKEIKIAISNAEASLNMEGLSVSKHTKSLCKKTLISRNHNGRVFRTC